MRVLIDECIDERFRNSLPEHDCQTARYAGLAGLKMASFLVLHCTFPGVFRSLIDPWASETKNAKRAPTICAARKGGTPVGRIPAKVGSL